MELGELRPHLHAQLGVQVGERLVHEEHLGLTDDGAAHRDALALTTRELLGLAVQEVLDAQHARGLFDPPVDLRARELAQLQPEGHVVVDVHVRVESVVLKDHGDVPVFGRDVVDQHIADVDVPFGDLLQPGYHPQGSGLSAARRADQYDEFFIFDFEVGIVNGNDVAVPFGHPFQRNPGHNTLLLKI